MSAVCLGTYRTERTLGICSCILLCRYVGLHINSIPFVGLCSSHIIRRTILQLCTRKHQNRHPTLLFLVPERGYTKTKSAFLYVIFCFVWKSHSCLLLILTLGRSVGRFPVYRVLCTNVQALVDNHAGTF